MTIWDSDGYFILRLFPKYLLSSNATSKFAAHCQYLASLGMKIQRCVARIWSSCVFISVRAAVIELGSCSRFISSNVR